jgi:hypothetical protein
LGGQLAGSAFTIPSSAFGVYRSERIDNTAVY